MDPASATGLAAAILQLAGFTGKVLSRAQELYESADSALLKNSELSIITKNFNVLLDRLVALRQGAHRPSDTVPDNKSLVIQNYAPPELEDFDKMMQAARSVDFNDNDSAKLSPVTNKVKGTELDKLVHDARGVTKELLSLLERLSNNSESNHRWSCVRQAILTIWNEGQLRDLERRVDRYRNQLNSALLSDLQYVQKKWPVKFILKCLQNLHAPYAE
jgi:hypothetical protein